MTNAERQAWEERFRAGDHAGSAPDPFLAKLDEYRALFPTGRRALEVACGAGRHAVRLAAQGWQVMACDYSLEGLRRARQRARERGVSLALWCQDLETVSLPADHFDLVVCFFYLRRELFPVLQTALRPGGLVVYKTYTTEQRRFAGGPRHPLHLLEPQELLHAFGGFRVLCYEETVQDRGVAQLIAQKPLRRR